MEGQNIPARQVVEKIIKDQVLIDMLFCPLCYYGSAREDDMDFGQFVILFKSIYLEGFCRPFEGVRHILRLLTDAYRKAGGMRKMKMGVSKILKAGNRITALELQDGSVINADNVISTAGLVETDRMIEGNPGDIHANNIGRLSFVETISVYDKQPADFGVDDTIVFLMIPRNSIIDHQANRLIAAVVICMPNNYQFGEDRELSEGFVRVTALANYALWKKLRETNEDAYQEAKEKSYKELELQTQKVMASANWADAKKSFVTKEYVYSFDYREVYWTFGWRCIWST